ELEIHGKFYNYGEIYIGGVLQNWSSECFHNQKGGKVVLESGGKYYDWGKTTNNEDAEFILESGSVLYTNDAALKTYVDNQGGTIESLPTDSSGGGCSTGVGILPLIFGGILFCKKRHI
ncbi:MAG: hypothetical protein LBL05_08435, partial [Synergistaceae bacterium]|nr:hypothetical protein [Synergistaceae bacterium]